VRRVLATEEHPAAAPAEGSDSLYLVPRVTQFVELSIKLKRRSLGPNFF
jgi:hypothetical protein